jgi:hypothetical protein
MQVDTATLQMALIGYQSQLTQITEKMMEIRKHLGRAGSKVGDGDVPASRRKRHMSAAGRKRVAEAQRKRWAAFHKGAGAKKGAAKRTLSPEARAKLAANLAKARAARAAKAKAATA